MVVSVRGEIDLSGAPTLWDLLAETITDTKRVVVDLSETEFIDSTALSVLVRSSGSATTAET